MDLNSGYCGDSSKLSPLDHGLIIFAVIGLLVVIMVLWNVFFVLRCQKLCPIVLFFACGIIFIYYFVIL